MFPRDFCNHSHLRCDLGFSRHPKKRKPRLKETQDLSEVPQLWNSCSSCQTLGIIGSSAISSVPSLFPGCTHTAGPFSEPQEAWLALSDLPAPPFPASETSLFCHGLNGSPVVLAGRNGSPSLSSLSQKWIRHKGTQFRSLFLTSTSFSASLSFVFYSCSLSSHFFSFLSLTM